jgi:outer membrane protein assembly factor BamB
MSHYLKRFVSSMNSLSLLLIIGSVSIAQDWPQFNGPNRDGVLDENFQLTKIPDGGLKKLWSANIGGGYSGPSISKNKIVVTSYVITSGTVTNNPGGRDELDGFERTDCFDATTGKVLWTQEAKRATAVSFGSGPRATPTIDGDVVYTLGSEGHLIAISMLDGKEIWNVALKERYPEAETPIWGFSSSPLVDDKLIYTVAGGKGSTLVALDKKTGKEVWKTGDTQLIGYFSPMFVGEGNQRQIIFWDPDKVNGIDPATGKVLWKAPLKPKYEMSISPPLIRGDWMYFSGIGEVATMFKLKPNRAGVETMWSSEGDPKMAVYCSNAGGVFADNFIAGADCGGGSFIAIDPKDGKRLWETKQPTSNGESRASHATAFVFPTKDGSHYLLSETGDFIIAKLTRAGYEEISRQHVIDATNSWQGRNVVWAYPAFANGNLYVRNDKELACYDLTP